MRKMLFLGLLSVLNVSINIAAMQEDANKKTAFERSKQQALWRMGGVAVGTLTAGAVALFSVKNNSDRCYPSIQGSDATKFLRVCQLAIIAGSGAAGAFIGAYAGKIGSGNNEYDKKRKKEIAQWRMGSALAGGAIFLIGASIVTNGMSGKFHEAYSYHDGGYGGGDVAAYTSCSIYPSEAIKIIGASGVGAAGSAVVAHGLRRSMDDLLDNDK